MLFLLFYAVSVAVAVLGFGFVKHAMRDCTALRESILSSKGSSSSPYPAKNKNFVITGGNSGLGFHTALVLAKIGGKVVLACRSLSRCRDARDLILKEVRWDMNVQLLCCVVLCCVVLCCVVCMLSM